MRGALYKPAGAFPSRPLIAPNSPGRKLLDRLLPPASARRLLVSKAIRRVWDPKPIRPSAFEDDGRPAPPAVLWVHDQVATADEAYLRSRGVRTEFAGSWTPAAADGALEPIVAVLSPGHRVRREAVAWLARTAAASETGAVFSDVETSDGDLLWAKPEWAELSTLDANPFAGLALARREILGSSKPTPLSLLLAARKSGRGATRACVTGSEASSLESAFPRSDVTSTMDYLRGRGLSGIRRSESGFSTAWTWDCGKAPRVSIVIPSKDEPVLLASCLSTLDSSNWPNREIVVVDNGSTNLDTLALYAHYGNRPGFQVVDYSERFNFQEACNRGARATSGEILLFLNNDTEVLDPDWIQYMVQWFEFDEVGAVGAKLLYPEGDIQHAGVIIGMGGFAGHVFHGSWENTSSPWGPDNWCRDMSAVTAACVAVRRSAFEDVSGFDPAFRLSHGDVDLCLRIRERGHRIVYTPHARLLHRESMTHRRRFYRADVELLAERMRAGRWLGGDPAYSPRLSYASVLPEGNLGEWDRPDLLCEAALKNLPRQEEIRYPPHPRAAIEGRGPRS